MDTKDRVFDGLLRPDRAWVERADDGDDDGDEAAKAASPELAHALRLVQRLADAHVPQSEIDTARERVRERVFAAIAAQVLGDDSEAFGERHVPAETCDQPDVALKVHDARGIQTRRARTLSPRRAPRRSVFVAAAALALGLTGLLAVSHVAASALPGAPLYSVKRGEEWLALRTAWSDTRQGDVLSEIARHRLVEAQAEAAAGDTAKVHALTVELDSTMRALIGLTARMSRQHEDTSVIAAQLSQALGDERTALAAARQQGQSVLVQSLTGAAQDQQQAMAAANLTMPSAPPAASPATAGPTPSPTPPPTPTVSGQPAGPSGAGQGQGSGTGSRSGSGSGSGQGGAGAPGSTGRGGSQGSGANGQSSSGTSGSTTQPPPPAPVLRGPFAMHHVM